MPGQAPTPVTLEVGSVPFGLFLRAHTDTRAVRRAFAFAVPYGFAWPPIYDASIEPTLPLAEVLDDWIAIAESFAQRPRRRRAQLSSYLDY